MQPRNFACCAACDRRPKPGIPPKPVRDQKHGTPRIEIPASTCDKATVGHPKYFREDPANRDTRCLPGKSRCRALTSHQGHFRAYRETPTLRAAPRRAACRRTPIRREALRNSRVRAWHRWQCGECASSPRPRPHPCPDQPRAAITGKGCCAARAGLSTIPDPLAPSGSRRRRAGSFSPGQRTRCRRSRCHRVW